MITDWCLGIRRSCGDRRSPRRPCPDGGRCSPEPMRLLLRCARWGADAVRNDIHPRRRAPHLRAEGVVLIVNETGIVHNSRASAGVPRQNTGTAGLIKNSQGGVLRTYATSRGRARVDHRLHPPEQSWPTDPEGHRAAEMPDDGWFATKPALPER
ncbi:transposase [Streptomyces tanashiensis]